MTLPYTLVGLAVILLCGVFYYETLDMEYAAAHTPQILCGLIVILAIWMVVDVERHRRAKDNATGTPDKADASAPYLDKFFKNVNLVRLGIITASIIVYVFLIDDIGYLIMTPIFLMFSLLFLRACSFVSALLITAVVVAIIYVGFVFLLGLPVPMGVLA